jgi:hypothetical protein
VWTVAAARSTSQSSMRSPPTAPLDQSHRLPASGIPGHPLVVKDQPEAVQSGWPQPAPSR